jgi:hypothetical protein
MNDQKDSFDEFDSLLKSQVPILMRMRAHPQELSSAELASIKEELEKIHPFLRVLTKLQMLQVMLQIFKTRPMDFPDLAEMLRKNNVRLKDASGEVELLALLWELENSKLVQGEWKEGENSRKRVYQLTDLGRAEIQPATSKEAELVRWLLARVPA